MSKFKFISTEGCAGEVKPDIAWEVLQNNSRAVLVDVRTLPEWTFVGVPNLSSVSKQAICVSWRQYPNMAVNARFVDEVLHGNAIGEDDPIFFLCRSGGRSLDAAIEMTQHGFTQCFNIIGGFEGDLNENGHRAQKNGWKTLNLPWEQR